MSYMFNDAPVAAASVLASLSQYLSGSILKIESV